MQTKPYIEVFFVEEWKSWCIAQFDAGGNQVNDSDYMYRKRDALKYALDIAPANSLVVVNVRGFTKQPIVYHIN